MSTTGLLNYTTASTKPFAQTNSLPIKKSTWPSSYQTVWQRSPTWSRPISHMGCTLWIRLHFSPWAAFPGCLQVLQWASYGFVYLFAIRRRKGTWVLFHFLKCHQQVTATGAGINNEELQSCNANAMGSESSDTVQETFHTAEQGFHLNAPLLVKQVRSPVFPAMIWALQQQPNCCLGSSPGWLSFLQEQARCHSSLLSPLPNGGALPFCCTHS